MAATPQAMGEPPALWYVAEDETTRPEAANSESLSQAQTNGYDLVTVPITTQSFRQKIFSLTAEWSEARSAAKQSDGQNGTVHIDVPADAILEPLSPEDTALTPEEANSAIIAKLSPWIDLGSRDPLIAQISRQVFRLELAYAAFCGLQNIFIHGPVRGGDVVQYARSICEGLGMGPYINLHILMPMTGELDHEHGIEQHLSELALDGDMEQDSDNEHDEYDSWTAWNTIRTVCSYSPRLGAGLEIPRRLPSKQLQSRWYSEPVRLAVFPRTTFLRNAKGYPVLHKSHQQFLTRLMRLRFPPWIMLTDVVDPSTRLTSSTTSADPTPAEADDKPKDPVPHLRYVRHLQQTQPVKTAMERFGHGYQDYIQSPLQPLTDNLESITYEVFEKDPVKYDWYERATELALRDLHKKLSRTLNVAVAGSGRGPLVSKALLAAKSANVPVRCWAVEKNPNAYVHLCKRNAHDPLWNNQVTVVKSDMRAWQGPVIDGQLGKVDVLISELLGSFADNELSPECLDGVQHVLLPDHGVNIPQSYSAHFTPLASPRLYNDLLSRAGTDKWEVPVVVMLQQQDFLSLQEGSEDLPVVHEAWSFSHPLPAVVLERARLRAGGSAELGGPGGQNGGDGSNEHNNRYCKKAFRCQQQGVCHGLAGYFETVLYASPETGQKVELSTNPLTMADKSEDMISWFPIFFPLKTPIHVPSNSTVEVSMWRATDDRKVWYEWIVEAHAADGSKKSIAMSELHSSRKHGCLM